MHSLLESYLSEVAAHLGALPPSRRNEELREMRAHLLSAVEAYQELGETEQKAVEATLRQFGPTSQVAGGLTRAWRRGHGSWLDAAKAGLFGVACLWSSDGLGVLLGHFLEGHPDVFPTLRPHFEPIFCVLLFGLSAALGALGGGRFARGAVKGAAWGTGLGYVGPMVVYEIIYAWNDSDILPVSLIFLLQAACLTGAVWARIWWREARAGQAQFARN